MTKETQHPGNRSQQRAELLRRLLSGQQETVSSTGITHYPALTHAPALPLQSSMWFVDQLDHAGAAYIMGTAVGFDHEVDPHVLRDALGTLVQRHSALRTTFTVHDDQLHQVIHDHAEVDLVQAPLPEDEPSTRRALRDALLLPAPLDRLPVLRTFLWTGDGCSIVELKLHHANGDGFSLRVLVDELLRLLRGEQLPPAPAFTQADIATWLAETNFKHQLQHWRNILRPTTPLSFAHLPRDTTPSHQLSHVLEFDIPEHISAALTALTGRLRCTPFMTALASFQALLCLITGRRDICIGTAVDRRLQWDLGPMIGCLVNTVALLEEVDLEQSFEQLVLKSRSTVITAFENADIPFEQVIHALAEEHGNAMQTPCSVYLVDQPLSPTVADGPQPVSMDPTGAQFDLVCHWMHSGEHLRIGLVANPAACSMTGLERMAEIWLRLLDQAIQSPATPIVELDLGGSTLTGSISSRPRASTRALLDAWQMPEIRSENRISVAADGERIVQEWLDRLLGVAPPSPAVVHIESWDATAALPVVLAAWRAGSTVQIDSPAADDPPRVRYGSHSWPLTDPPPATPTGRTPSVDTPSAAWSWPDGSVLSHNELHSALDQLEHHLREELGHRPDSITLLGPATPLSMLALHLGLPVARPRRCTRPDVAIGRATDIVQSDPPPRTAIITDAMTESFGVWAGENEVACCGAILVPGVGLFLSDTPATIGSLGHRETWIGTPETRLPDHCPGQLQVRSDDGSTITLPWVLTREPHRGSPVLRWVEPPVQPWPPVSAEALGDTLGHPVTTARTREGVAEFVSSARTRDLMAAAHSLGLWSDLLHPLSTLENGGHAVIDAVLSEDLVSLAGELGDGDGPLPFIKWADGTIALPQQDQQSILTGISTPERPPFITQFLRVSEHHPSRTAVILPSHDGQASARISYRDLALVAGERAGRLTRAGVGRNSIVAIQGGPDLDTLVSILAVSWCGGVWVPLDRTHPSPRRMQVLSAVDPDLVITDAGDEEWPWPVIPHTTNESQDADAAAPEPVAPDQNAYIIFTSGSTGRPKGVTVTHRALSNLTRSIATLVGFDSESVICWQTTPTFDISMVETIMPLTCGAALVICPPDLSRNPQSLARVALTHEATHIQASPRMWASLLDTGELPESIVRMTGGEPLPLSIAKRMAEGEAWNLYGPTETTVWSSACRVLPPVEHIAIGRPLDNTIIAVVDEQGAPVPPGAIGEIVIGGVGVSPGYWNNESETRARFRDAPWASCGEVVYHTGDRGRLGPDGQLVCLGRDDGQVKIHGYRVELGDIEQALEQDPAVARSITHVADETVCALVLPQEDAVTRRIHWHPTLEEPWRDDVDGSPIDEEIILTHLKGLARLLDERQGPAVFIASGLLGELARSLDLGQVVTSVDDVVSPVDSIVVLAPDRRFADLDHLTDFCSRALERVTPEGCLILTDLMTPGGHGRVHRLRSEAAGVAATYTEPHWLLVNPDELLTALGRSGQLRPRVAATSLAEHRVDLMILAGEPTAPSEVLTWQDRLSDPDILGRFLDEAPEGTALVGIPREVLPTHRLLEPAIQRWRLHTDATTLTLVAGPATPPQSTGKDPVPWFHRDPGLLAWERSALPRIKQKMADRVPPYMVPSRLRAVARFPATLNDKVDRRAANEIWEAEQFGSATPTARAPETTLHEHFTSIAHTFPDHVAVDGPDGVWTYHELAQRVDALAGRLLHAGCRTGSRIVVALPRSNQFIAAVLAISRIQGSFVPLDVSQPAARNALIVADSCADAAVTEATNRHLVEQLPRLIDLDEEHPGAGTPLPGTGDPDDEAYVIFTSGTSGRPKGVRVAHRGIATLLDLQQDRLETGPGRRVLQFAAPSFDAFVWELTLSLLHGGTLVLRGIDDIRPGPDLTRTLREDRVTDVLLPPSTLAVLPPDEPLPDTLTIVSGGEPLPTALIDRYAPHVALFNAYGPTECTVVTHMSQRLRVGDAPVIGEAAPGVDAYIVTDSGELARPGELGELHVGGRSLAIGYLNQPQREQESFIHPCFDPSLRLYRTGDMVTPSKGQILTHRGRRDEQVKIRGYRVEPAEVEAVISGLPGIRQAAVVVDGTEQPRLVAFVVGGDPSSLASELSRRLPAPMIPELHFVGELPTNANGKVDRPALVSTLDGRNDNLGRGGAALGVLAAGSGAPRVISQLHDRHGRTVPVTVWETPSLPGPQPRAGDVARALRGVVRSNLSGGHRGDLLSQIQQIWESILDITVPDADIDFFTIGGHSLSAAHVVLRLRELGHHVSVADFFAHPTINALNQLIVGNRREVSDEDLKSAALLPSDIDPSACITSDSGRTTAPRNIMVTGGTGFLGSRLVVALLERTGAIIHALVRGDDPDHAAHRLRSAIDRFGFELSKEQLSRLRVLHGDLHVPGLGLDTSTMSELESTIDVIFHAGASVNLLDSFEHMIGPNVLGTTQMLRLASTGRLKSFHHISTIATVLGAVRSGRPVNEDTEIEPSEVLRTGYVMTKWVGEQLVAEARRRGLPARIYRLSRVAQDRITGVHNPADAQLLFLAGAIQVGTYPDASEDFASSPNDAVCVDDLCEWLITLALADEQAPHDHHLVSPHCLTLRQIGDQLRRAGFRLRSTTLEGWTHDLARNAPKDQDTTVQFSSDLRNMSAALPELGDYVVGSSRTQDALRTLGVTQRAIDEDLMAHHIHHLITSGFLPSPRLPDKEEHHD